MNIKYTPFGTVEESNIYLCKPKQSYVCSLNGVDRNSFTYTENLKDFDMIEFDVWRYIDIDGERVESNGYHNIDYLMEIYLDNVGRFIIDVPPDTNTDNEKEYKHVSAKSLEWDFLKKDISGFEVGTGTDTSYERMINGNVDMLSKTIRNVIFYDEEDSTYSFLDIILSYVVGWTIGDVSESLKNKVPRLTTDSSNLYAFLTQDVSKNLQCIFKFDTINKTVNVYDENDIGIDTNVYISMRNLLNSVSVTPQTEQIYTRYLVKGGDDLDIRQVNFGEKYVVDLSYYMTTSYVSKELIDKYNNYLDRISVIRKDYISNARNYSIWDEIISELTNRVPLDDLDMNYSGMDEDKLFQLYDYYTDLVKTIEGYYTVDGILNEKALQASEYWWDYCSYTKYIIPNLLIAISEHWKQQTIETLEATLQSYKDEVKAIKEKYTVDGVLDEEALQASEDYETYKFSKWAISTLEKIIENYDKYQEEISDEDYKAEYDGSWKTNWDLYGQKELENQISSMTEEINALSNYSRDYGLLSGEEQAKIVKKTYVSNHERYDKLKEDRDSAQSRLEALTQEIECHQKIADDYAKNMENTAAESQLEYPDYNFTQEEIDIIKSLYVDGAYTNENFIITSSSTASDKVDTELELFEYAKEDIAKQSKPQFSFDVAADNLFAMQEFKTWHQFIKNGNFIYVSNEDGISEKVRLISISFNPMLPNDSDLNFTFSNITKWNGQRSDLIDLLDSANYSKGSISRNGNLTSEDFHEITAELLANMLNSKSFKDTVQTITTTTPTVENAEQVELTGEQINVMLDYLKNNNITAHITNGTIDGFTVEDSFISTEDFIKNTDFPLLDDGTVNEEYQVLSGVKLDSENKKIETPQIDIYDNKFNIVGEFTLGRRKETDDDGNEITHGILSSVFGDNCVASGLLSFAGGQYTTVKGRYSLAYGLSNTVSADYSYAFGEGNSISSPYGTAVGKNNTLRGDRTLAFGFGNNITVYDSICIGSSNTCNSGIYDTAIGSNNTVSDAYSTAIGYGCTASGQYSVSIGTYSESTYYRCVSIGYYSKATGYSSIAVGEYSESTSSAASAYGEGAKATGYASTAIGYSCKATGSGSTAVGYTCSSVGYSGSFGYQASCEGTYSLAMGYAASCKGYDSMAIGSYAKSSASNQGVSIGYSTQVSANANYSVSIGIGTIASGNTSIAIGNASQATSSHATSVGDTARANGVYSLAVGNTTYAKGNYSTSIGNNGFANGDYSLTIGYSCYANGVSSASMGFSTTANGNYSFAFGIGGRVEKISTTVTEITEYGSSSSYVLSFSVENIEGFSVGDSIVIGDKTCKIASISENVVTLETELSDSYISVDSSVVVYHIGGNSNGDYSITMGEYCVANGNNSFSTGQHTISSADGSFVCGKYNIEDVDLNYAFIRGNGTSTSERSNAFSIDWNGNTYQQGDIYFNGDYDTPLSEKIADTSSLINRMNELETVNNELTEQIASLKEQIEELTNNSGTDSVTWNWTTT